MKLTIEHNFTDVARHIAEVGKQAQYAAAVALTRTAQKVKEAQDREMRDVFDRPTPYTMSSWYVTPATKANLMAVVWLKNFAAKGTPATDFLLPQIQGGERKMKRFERALQAVGALPEGYRIVPGEAAKLDSYGNLDRGQIVQILSYFKAFPEAGYKANMTDKRRAALARGSKKAQGYTYFVGRPGDRLPLGIWQSIKFSKGSAIKPVMIFVPSVAYKAIFDFKYVANTVMTREFAREYELAYQQAMRTAR